MNFYRPSSLSQGYIPRRSYRPAPVSTYLDDESYSATPFEGLGYPSFPQTFSPRLDAETRYRRAVHELQAAEEEFEAHLSLKRARQAAILHDEAVRRERALAIQAEVERIERTRALEAKLAEEYEWHQRAHHAEVALDRARRQKHALLHAVGDTNPRHAFAFERPLATQRRTLSGPSRRPVLHDGEVPTLEGLLGLFTGDHARLHPHGPLEHSAQPAPIQQHPAEPTPAEKQDVEGDPFDAVLEFIHSLAAHSKETVNESETITKVRLLVRSVNFSGLTYFSQAIPVSQQPEQAVPVEGKGKGKATAERSEGPAFLQTLLGAHARGPSDQELKDIELAIKLSLEDRNAGDAKKVGAAKAVRFSPGASSSRVSSCPCSDWRKRTDVCMQVTLDGALPSSHAPSSASNTATAVSKPIPSPAPQPVSPLTTIRAVRNQLSNVESTFKFPAGLDFDEYGLVVSRNNAPVRAYQNTLNGLLEQLDAIESDGDEEVRNVRREVVREVEKALEDLERRVSEKAPKPQVTKDVEVKGYHVETEELGPLDAKDAVPADASEAAEPPVPVPPADAVADLSISEEYLAPSYAAEPAKPAVAELGDDAVAQTANEGISSPDANETAPVLEDSSDSLQTIIATPASGPSSDVHVSEPRAPETYLTSMSHDQFTFPPKPAYSDSGASLAGAREDAVLVDTSEEGESVKSGEDGWSEVDA